MQQEHSVISTTKWGKKPERSGDESGCKQVNSLARLPKPCPECQ